jgi:hypothetical protein
VALSNGDGAQRWNKLVTLLDEMLPAQALGGNKVSDLIQGMEQKLGVEFGPQIMGKTTSIGFAVGNPLNAPFVVTRTEGPGFMEESGASQVPVVLILETADEKAAQSITALVVKLSQIATDKEVKPQTKKIKGQDISSIKINPHYSVAYGSVGNTVVIGPYAEGVAQALADGADKTGLASDAKAVAQLKEFKDPIGVMVLKPGSLVFGWLAVSGYRSASKAATRAGPDGKEVPDKPDPQHQPKTTVSIQKDSPETAKMKKKIANLLDQEPTLVIGVTRGTDFLSREGKSAGWEKFVPKIVNFMADMIGEYSRRERFPAQPRLNPPSSPMGKLKTSPSPARSRDIGRHGITPIGRG